MRFAYDALNGDIIRQEERVKIRETEAVQENLVKEKEGANDKTTAGKGGALTCNCIILFHHQLLLLLPSFKY
jgi:hypothetical protein